MSGKSLVVCPVYNEEDTLVDFYHDLRKYYFGDVLFVDDGSTDSGREYLGSIKNVFLVRHSKRQGYGAALLSGFNLALSRGYKKIVTLDVDLQHNPEHIQIFLRQLLEKEIVLGSRYIRVDKCLDIPQDRLIINRYIRGLLNKLFGYDFTDPFCGFRAYRDSFLRKVNFNDQSYGIGLEILLEIIRTKAKFEEVAVEAIYFKDIRKFLDGLDNPRTRLLYYLEVISKKRKELADEEKISICESAS